MSTEQTRVDNELFLGRLDPDLESLRGQVRFKALVENHEGTEAGEEHEEL